MDGWTDAEIRSPLLNNKRGVKPTMAALKVVRQTMARALLETSCSLNWLGMTMMQDLSFWELGPQHRTFVGLLSTGNAVVSPTAKVAELATILGGVNIGDQAVIETDVVVTGPATIGDKAFVGSGAVIKAGSTVGAGARVAPEAIVLPNTIIPPNELWQGAPAKFHKKI